MADIKRHTDKIRKAIYGKEVRGSIADGIEAINNEVEDATEVSVNVEQRQESVEQQFDDLQQNYTEESPSTAEIVAARTNTKTNENYETIGRRMDEENKKISSQLAETEQELNNAKAGINALELEASNLQNTKMNKNTTDIWVSQIDKNKGLFDETYFSDEVKQQWSGNTPIHSTPAPYSITDVKLSNKSVKPEHVDFINMSTNLYNKDTDNENTAILSDGSLVGNYDYSVSDFIRVEPSGTYYQVGVPQVAEYDADKKFIRRINTGIGSGVDRKSFVVSSDTYFIRLNANYKNYPIIWLNKGDKEQPYEEYYAKPFKSFKVGKDNLIDKAVDSSKRTDLGNLASISIGSPYKLPNIDLTNKNVEFFGNTYINYRNRRFNLFNINEVITKVDFSNLWLSGGVNPMIYFNVETLEFEVIGTSLEASENSILICVLHKDGSSNPGLLGVSSLFEYTVDDIDPAKSLGTLCTFNLGNPYKLPNIDLVNRKIELYGLTTVHYNNERYLLNDESGDIYEIDFSEVWEDGAISPHIYFNTVTKEFDVIKATTPNLVTENHILFCIIHKNGHDQNSILGVTILGDYTLNGKKSTVDSQINHYTENIPDGWYEAPVSEGYDATGNTTDTMQLEDVYSVFDSLVDDNPDYITKTNMGLDSTGTYYIYRYEFIPEEVQSSRFDKKLPKILIFTNVHGTEKASTISVRNLMEDVCNNWQDNELLEFIRFNVQLIIIPIANPWGFLNHTRENGRGVDINRNNDYRWETGHTDPESREYRGTEPYSEQEAQYIRDTIDQNLDAIACFDYHTNGSSGNVYNTLFWQNIELFPSSQGFEELNIIAKNIISKLTRESQKRYDIPTDSGFVGYISYQSRGGTIAASAYSRGIPASNVECCRKLVGEEVIYSAKTMQICTEFIGNKILNTVREFSE